MGPRLRRHPQIRAPGARSQTEHSRRAARYLSKYVGKAFDQHDVFGRHRYERAQGFNPRKVEYLGSTRHDAMSWSVEQMGGAAPDFVWTSDDVEDFAGPPTSVAFWDL